MRRIVVDDLRGIAIAALLEEHLQDMRAWSPPGSVHALDLNALRQPHITFWTLWEGTDLLGCGALKGIDTRHGEIKSMRTAAAHRGQGVGSAMLTHILTQARARDYTRLSLETGSQSTFSPARALYSRFGFEVCEPFAGYAPDPNSCFMCKVLA